MPGAQQRINQKKRRDWNTMAMRAAEQAELIKAKRDLAVAKRRTAQSKTIVVTVPQTNRGRQENKYVDGYYSVTALTSIASAGSWASTEINPRDSGGNYGCLPMPQQGDGFADRDGRKITVKKIVIRGQINWLGENALTAGGNTSPIVRLLIVKDKQTNKAALSAENVIGPGDGSNSAGSSLADAGIMSLSLPAGWGRYQIMKDKMYTRPFLSTFYDGTDGAQMGCSVPFKFTLKLNTEVSFDVASSGHVGAIIDNSFHLIGACGITAGTPPTISYIARTTFLD